MDPGSPVLCLLSLLLLLSSLSQGHATISCPANCRCYSLTVECGSMGIRDIPKHVPPTTQVPGGLGRPEATRVRTLWGESRDNVGWISDGISVDL